MECAEDDPGCANPVGTCMERDPVRIVTGELPTAIVEVPYNLILEAVDGVPPYDWRLLDRPGWLSIDADTGRLSGQPDQVASGVRVAVKVEDQTSGRDSFFEAEFFLDVEACYDTQRAACYEPDGDVCLEGVRECSDSQWGPCRDLLFSNDMEHCGPDCEPCDPQTADRCHQGGCACGGGSVCAGGDACCEEHCIDVSDDDLNCGGCGVACAEVLLNAEGVDCEQGACVFTGCRAGYADCNSDESDGCETEMSAQVCGESCRDCTGLVDNVIEIRCKPVQGVWDCGYSECAHGWLDCDGDPANGCETVQNNENCGACGLSCDSECLQHAVTGEYYCGCDQDSDCPDGARCCVGVCVLYSDPAHCGGCGNDCADQLASVDGMTCDQGVCDYVACQEFFLDCDGNRQNGCEIPSSVNNCGACGMECNQNASCDGSNCVCEANWGDCNDSWENGCETDLLTTTDHCGDCDTDCTVQVQNAASGIICDGGLCDYGSCLDGYRNCDSDGTNGCEKPVWATDSCGISCTTVDCNQTVVNAVGQHCDQGGCDYSSCVAGYESCDADRTDGCEEHIWAVDNCGINCVTVDCTGMHADGPQCNNGFCEFSGPCHAGWGDCNSMEYDGCEEHIWAVDNCGTTCANARNCNSPSMNASGVICDQGSCDYTGSCFSHYADCDGDRTNGCEANLYTDEQHCGDCDTVCEQQGGTNTCTNGNCVPDCDSVYGNCDNNPNNGCETMLTTNQNCGQCGLSCGNLVCCPVNGHFECRSSCL